MGSVLTIKSSAKFCGDPGVSTSAGLETTLKKILIKTSRPRGWRPQGPPGVGESVGLSEGVEEGEAVGAEEGAAVGPSEGTDVGPVDGATEGADVGPVDGATEGLSVGDAVAPVSEGDSEGLPVGDPVGGSEGVLDGAALSKLLICSKSPPKNVPKSAAFAAAIIFFSALFSASTGSPPRRPLPILCLLKIFCRLRPPAAHPFGAINAAAARERANGLCFMVAFSLSFFECTAVVLLIFLVWIALPDQRDEGKFLILLYGIFFVCSILA